MRMVWTLAVAALLWQAGLARGASFDCSRASTHVERLICSDPTLSGLDDQLARAYRAAAGTPDADAVRAGQRRWLKEVRNKCGDIPCLTEAYDARIKDISGAPAGRTSQELQCAPPTGPKVPQSVDQCDFPIPDECTATVYLRNYEGASTACVRRLIQVELDKRLPERTKVSAEQVKREARAQTEFLNASKAECARYYACDGTASLLNGDGCTRSYVTYRAHQVRAINQGLLELRQLPGKNPAPPWTGEAKRFAQALCEMPASVWKDRALPEDCARRVLLDMEAEHIEPDADSICEVPPRDRSEAASDAPPTPSDKSKTLERIMGRQATRVAGLGFSPAFLNGTIYLQQDLFNRPQPFLRFDQWLSLVLENQRITKVTAISFGRSRGVLLKVPGVESHGFLFKFDEGDIFPTHFVKGDQTLAVESTQDAVALGIAIAKAAADAVPK